MARKKRLVDFCGFQFNGVHSSELGLTRVSDGSRYNEDLVPGFSDKTAQIPGGDGMLYWESFYSSKPWNINVAFDDLTESEFRRLRQVFNTKERGELIFDELPYKVYKAKIQSPPQFKYICFDQIKDELVSEEITTETKNYDYQSDSKRDLIRLGSGLSGDYKNYYYIYVKGPNPDVNKDDPSYGRYQLKVGLEQTTEPIYEGNDYSTYKVITYKITKINSLTSGGKDGTELSHTYKVDQANKTNIVYTPKWRVDGTPRGAYNSEQYIDEQQDLNLQPLASDENFKWTVSYNVNKIIKTYKVRNTRVYKGEGAIQFISYYPYARSKHKFLDEYATTSYPNLSEWQGVSGLLPSKTVIITENNKSEEITFDIQQSKNGLYKFNLYNPGDVPTDWVAYFHITGTEDGSSFPEYIKLRDINGDILNEIYFSIIDDRKIGDYYLRISSYTNLIEGAKSRTSETTGNLYNHHIIAGDFFKIPVGRFVLEIKTFSDNVRDPGCAKFEYDYLYY